MFQQEAGEQERQSGLKTSYGGCTQCTPAEYIQNYCTSEPARYHDAPFYKAVTDLHRDAKCSLSITCSSLSLLHHQCSPMKRCLPHGRCPAEAACVLVQLLSIPEMEKPRSSPYLGAVKTAPSVISMRVHVKCAVHAFTNTNDRQGPLLLQEEDYDHPLDF